MLDGHHRRHSISDVRPCEVGVFFLQDTEFPGIVVHHRSECGLKTGQMGAALCIVDVVAEAQHIFPKFIDILEGNLHGDALGFSLKIDRLMEDLTFFVQILDKAHDTFRLMEGDALRFVPSLILKYNGQLRIQIGSLVKTDLHLRGRESCLLENLRIRQEIHQRTCGFCPSELRKQALLQLNGGDSPLIVVVMDIPLPADLDIQICGQSVDHRGADTMKASACLIRGVIKLSACMQCGEYKPLG